MFTLCRKHSHTTPSLTQIIQYTHIITCFLNLFVYLSCSLTVYSFLIHSQKCMRAYKVRERFLANGKVLSPQRPHLHLTVQCNCERQPGKQHKLEQIICYRLFVCVPSCVCGISQTHLFRGLQRMLGTLYPHLRWLGDERRDRKTNCGCGKQKNKADNWHQQEVTSEWNPVRIQNICVVQREIL